MKKAFFAICLLAISFFLSFSTLEVFLRIKQKRFALENFIASEWNLLSAGFPVTHDPQLGWVTKAGLTLERDAYQKTVTLLENGIRSNGEAAKPKGPPVLVVGASHAFGTEASDNETWEAYLEKKIHRPVINAAVFGYGIDQMVLRFEYLAPIVKPSIGILAFHPENISQCEMSQKYANKPYFTLEGETLALKNTPVPETKKTLSPWQRVLGYSLLAHTVGSRFFPVQWKQSRGDVRAHAEGQEVACRLLDRFVAYCKKENIRPLIVVHHWQEPAREFVEATDKLLTCLKGRNPAEILDLRDPLEATRRTDPKYYASLFQFHMTPDGNKYVAAQLERLILQK